MSEITRRGFLSLVAGLAAMSALPAEAEPIVQRIIPLVPPKHSRLVRYAMGLHPESMEPILPGRITILRACPPIVMRPNRLMMNTSGFNLLHLGHHGNPIMENEIDSDFFTATAYGNPRLEMATIEPGQEIIIAAVNRNSEPRTLLASLMGYGLQEMSIEEYETEQAMLKADESNYIDEDLNDEE